MSKITVKSPLTRRGFTLIELLVVITIIALLLGFIVVGMNETRARARDGQRVTDVKTLEIALEKYYSQNRSYPNTLDDLEPDFVEEIPVDPRTKDPYSYTLENSGRDYVLITTNDDESARCRVYSPRLEPFEDNDNISDCPFQ